MLRDAFHLAYMDARFLLTRRETLMWTFVMPVIFFYFIGAIMGNSIGQVAAPDPIAIRVPSDAGFLADQLTERLKAVHYRPIRTSTDADWQKFARRLEIPEGFTTSLLAGRHVDIRFSRTGRDDDAEFDRVRIYRAIFSLDADLSLAGPAPTPERLAALAAAPRTLTLAVHAAGKRVDPPTGFEQSVPGTMVMFTLLVLFTSGAVTLTIERRLGILRRLASAPLSRGAVVLGKWGARMVVGTIQISFALLTGTLLFHVHWGPNLPVLMLVLLAYGALAASLAMLLGNLGRTEAQVLGLGIIFSNLMAGLGGCWWPIEVTPLWAQKFALFLPTGLTMNALHKLVNFGASPAAVVPHLCVLVVAASLALWVLARTFRFQ